MGRLMLVLGLVGFCSLNAQNAFAESPRIIAEARTTAGFTPTPERYPQGVRVYSSGHIEKFVGAKSTQVARLSDDQVAAFQTAIDSIGEGFLQDQEPGGPLCTDVPQVTYAVRKSGSPQDELLLEKRANCHTYLFNEGKGRIAGRALRGLADFLMSF